MPCMCWFTPDQASHRLVKASCQTIIDELKILHREGDAIGLQLKDVKELLDHLWENDCPEKPKN